MRNFLVFVAGLAAGLALIAIPMAIGFRVGYASAPPPMPAASATAESCVAYWFGSDPLTHTATRRRVCGKSASK